MICVGIDVAKDKHDCFILSSEGEVLADVFTIQNNAEGFNTLLQTIRCCTRPADKIKVGLEATGHYSYNILGFLLNTGLPTYVINPLHTNLYRKSLSLRKTNYDVIFLGFPIWWYVAPTIINTFLESADFSGKKIILFATSGGSKFGKTVEELKVSVSANTEIIEGKLLNGRQSIASIKAWTDTLNI